MRTQKQNKFLTFSLLILLLLSLSASCWVIIWHRNLGDNFIAEIEILEDEDFESKYHIPGEGTAANPYRIENLHLKSNRPFGILIKNTTKHFIINNCIINSKNIAIYICFTKFGTASIENNLISSINRNGIEAIYSPGLVIQNNIITACYFGISVTGCYNSTIRGNSCSNCVYGMFLVGHLNNSIISENYCNNNTDSGIVIYDIDIVTFDYIWSSNNVTFLNNTCLYNNWGMGIGYCDNSIVENNNCSFNNYYGLFCDGINNTVRRNTCINNSVGIRLRNLINSTINENALINNQEYSVKVSQSNGNFFYHNNFINNNEEGLLEGEKQAFDDSTNESTYGKNIWFNTFLSEGNYWSDLIWFPGIVYEIDGSDCTDEYPLENQIIIFYTSLKEN